MLLFIVAGVFAGAAREEDRDAEPRLLRPHGVNPLADQGIARM